jgi:GH15 family glucan-1,4-alpha-glucosidase
MPRDLPLANGRLFVAFDHEHAIRDLCWPYLGQENHGMGRQSRLGFAFESEHRWLGEARDLLQSFETGSLVTRVTGTYPDWRCSFEITEAVHPTKDLLVRSIQIRSLAEVDRTVSVRAHNDFLMGGDEVQGGVFYEPSLRALVHHRRNRWLLTAARVERHHGFTSSSCDARSVSGGRGCAAKLEAGHALDGNPVAVGSVDSAAEVEVHLPAMGSATVEWWFALGADEGAITSLHEEVLRL